MGIFRKHQVDLSDEGLALTAEASNIEEQSAAEGAGAESKPLGEELEPIPIAENEQEPAISGEEALAAPPLAAAEKAEREELWQAATEEISASWPQALGQGEQLVAKMIEVGSRYGDPSLWQRSPKSIMREAAIELFGLPSQRDNDYATKAALAARQAALTEMHSRNQHKLGLNKKPSRQVKAPALTEEDKIVEAISKARGRTIF